MFFYAEYIILYKMLIIQETCNKKNVWMKRKEENK